MADVESNVKGPISENPEDWKNNESLFQNGQSFNHKAWLMFKQNIRPWKTFFHPDHFNSPPSSQLTERIIQNIMYFCSNYFVISLVPAFYFLIHSSLLLVLVICCNLAVFYMLGCRNPDKKLQIFGLELTLLQQYTLVTICLLPIYILAEGIPVMFTILGASIFFNTLHATFFNITVVQQGEEQLFHQQGEEGLVHGQDEEQFEIMLERSRLQVL